MAESTNSEGFSFTRYIDSNVATMTSLNLIRLPRVMSLMSWLICIGLAVMIASLFLPWVQTSAGLGRVTALNPADRLQSINAAVSGRIADWFVQDGDSVQAGDPIVLIQDIDTALVPRLQSQLDAARLKLEAAKEAVDTAEIDYNRQRQLFEEGLSSRLQFEQAAIKVRELRVSLAEATTEFTQAEVNLSRQGSQLVTAPRDGVITRLEAGDVATIVSQGQTLATFMPSNIKRAIEIYVNGRDIGLVHPGRQVTLQFEGWPAFQFSGIPELAAGTFPGIVNFVEPSARADGRFRVLITEPDEAECNSLRHSVKHPGANPCSWPPETFVRLGANVRGWVLMETVPLGYELWRLLNNFPPVSGLQSAQGSSNA